MQKNERIFRYEQAAAILPSRLRKAALALADEEKAAAEELRLRAGRPLSALLPTGELPLEAEVEPEELETLCDIATEFSRYAAAETIREGFLPVRGGFRVGLCGTAVMKDGVNTNLKNLSSAVIRIARERRGAALNLAPRLFQNGMFLSTLILSPPGGGKTTLLRDLVRCLSAGGLDCPPQRISLIDERGEVAVVYRGVPQMDVGPRTDVLDACPKALGIPIVLRAMNPQIIAVDEITLQEDLTAMSLAAGCGVGLLATIHAAGVPELMQKPLYRQLLDNRVFRLAVRILRDENGRAYELEELPC
ncbi:MAG: stage III sporulation protein AA [Oscillibacter sp.]|nr:stage III sporulation protein AA [Oscillibacter sp.]